MTWDTQKGYTADLDIIEIPKGYGVTFIGPGNYDEEKMVKSWGTPFHIVSPGVAVKKYPCCMLTHRALDAVFELIEKYNIHHDQAAAVVVGSLRIYIRCARMRAPV